MTELTQEQLAEIQSDGKYRSEPRAARHIAALLAHIDAQAAKLAKVQELEKKVETLSEFADAAKYRRLLNSLRASILALAEEWEVDALELRESSNPDCASGYTYCAIKLRQLGEGNGRD